MSSFFRILKLKICYPSLRINFGSYVAAGCHIVCSDDSIMILNNVFLAKGVTLRVDKGGEMQIYNSYIGYNSVITANTFIYIDQFCEIAEMVVIRDQDHVFGKGILRYSGAVSVPIKINKNVWIGAKASVLKGVEIGENAVVAASAVVVKSIPENEVWAGVPAKKIK